MSGRAASPYLIHLCSASLQKKTRLVPCGPYLQALVGQAASALSLACPTANHSKAIPFKARAAAFPLLLLASTKPFLTSFAGEFIETHGPYQHGSGFKTVNAPDPALQPFPANTPPAASNQSIGVSFPGHFASEFGCRYRFHAVSFAIPPPPSCLSTSFVWQNPFALLLSSIARAAS